MMNILNFAALSLYIYRDKAVNAAYLPNLPKNSLKVVSLTSLLTVILLLSGCSFSKDKAGHPEKNPHPKLFFILTGKVAPEINKQINVIFKQYYVSTNPACNYEANKLAGLVVSLQKADYYHVKSNADNRYTLKIPLDAYLPGKCGWQPFELMWATTPKHVNIKNNVNVAWSTLACFGDGTQKYNLKILNLICQQGYDNCRTQIVDGTYYSLNLRPNQPYTLKLNVLHGGKHD